MSVQQIELDTTYSYQEKIQVIGDLDKLTNIKFKINVYEYNLQAVRFLVLTPQKVETDMIDKDSEKTYRVIRLSYDYNLMFIITNGRREFPMWVLKYR